MKTKQGLIGAVATGIGASVCCVLPLILLMLGIGGAWIATLTQLEPLRPVFVAATVVLLGWTAFKLRRASVVCEPGSPCADPRVRRRQWWIFWSVAVPLLVLLAFPWYAPWFY